MPLYSNIYHNTYHRRATIELDREMGNSSWWMVDKQKEAKRGRARKESKEKERERKGGKRTNVHIHNCAKESCTSLYKINQ